MHPSSASADLPRIANLAVLLRQNCFFIALFPAELGGTTTGTAGRTVCKSCTAHHKKSPDQMAWGSWWSIVHSRRTFKQAYHCCGQSASNQETAAPRNASALARVLFQLIFVQSNAVQQITLILGGCIIIDSEPFADSTELVKHFNSSRDIRLISISIKTPFPKNVRARTVPWPKIFNS